jgi:hypothetical protein
MKYSKLTYLSGIFGTALALGLFYYLPQFELKSSVSPQNNVSRTPAQVDPTIDSKTDPEGEPPEDGSIAVRLAESPFEESGKLTCAYSSLMLSYLDELPDTEVQALLQREADQYAHFVEQTKNQASRRTKKLQKKILRDLRLITQSETPRDKLKESLELPCRASVSLGSTLVRTTGMAGTLLTSAMTLPIRFIAKMGIGAYSRKETPNRGASYSTLTGSVGGITQVTGIGQQAVRLALGAGNPWTLARTTVFAIDMEAAKVCAKVNPKSVREVRFCKNYKLIKDNEFKITEIGEKLGVQIGEQLLHTFDFRSDKKLNLKICEASAKKQYRVARRSVERLADELKSWGVSDNYQVKIIPPEVGGCIALRIITETEEDEAKIALRGTGMMDGLLYTTVTQGDDSAIDKDPKPDPVTDEEVCQAIYSTQISFAANQAAISKQKFEAMQMVLNPKRYAQLGLDPVKMAPEMISQQPLEDMVSKRSLIMVLAPTEEQKLDFEKLQPEFERLTDQFKSRRKKLKRLMKSQNFNECLENQAEIGFNYKEFKDITDSLSSFQIANRVKEFQIFMKETRQAGKKLYVFKHLRLPWEVIEFNNLNDIRVALGSPDVANVIFVSHGESNGKIIDPRLNSVPATVFEWLSPSIQSISLFSCHTQDAIVSYRMKEQLASQISYHPIRYAGYVNTYGLLERSNQAPSLALSRFIEDIDKEMSMAQEGTRRAQSIGRATLKKTPTPSLCSVQIRGATILKGSFAVKVNSKWAGVLYPETIDPSGFFAFPCSWLNLNGNRVFLENISLVEKSTMEIVQIAAQVVTPQGEKTYLAKPENIRRRPEDQSISAVSFHW